MKIIIAKTTLDMEYLIDCILSVEDEMSVIPYIIVNQQTLDEIAREDTTGVFTATNGSYEYRGYPVLIDKNLRYGEVELR